MSTIIQTYDPTTATCLDSYDSHDHDQIERIIASAHAAFHTWSNRPVQERTDLLRQVGRLLTQRRQEYAELITSEMGKPIGEGLAEVDKCAWNCEVVADHAAAWLADQDISSSASRSWLAYEPLGTIFAVMPWNFPFWQVLRFACAAIAAGNTAVLKHSPNVTGCALAIDRLFTDAGGPAGLFSAVLIADGDLAELVPKVIGDDRVAAVTLTGSERAGVAVGTAAGRSLKKSVLELGGSDPFVVLGDADLRAAAVAAARSRFGNAGQSCIAAKRFIVVAEVADEFAQLLLDQVNCLHVGDPRDAETTIGPLAREDLRTALHDQVTTSIAEGATLVTGGHPIDRPGYFYAPTVLDNVTATMKTFQAEVFGPVASIIRAEDDEHAAALANDTPYGLGASVWGRPDHALSLGRQLRSGALFINAVVASDPRLPFGGTRRSGHGRELGAEGVREFTNIRTVYIGDVHSPPPIVTE